MSIPSREQVIAQAHALGFDAAGVAALTTSEHADFYRAWIAQGRHGEMAYLARADAVERRIAPRAAPSDLRTAIVVALNYWPGDDGGAAADASRGVIARYARGRDYHKVIRKKLVRLLAWLEAEAGRALPATRAHVDTGPVLERELARRAGLGWFGRSTMLLHPRRGSYFFLGALLTELELEASAPFAGEHCGSCRACVDACPTGALLDRDANGAPIIDARRCISYLTIEQRGPISRELRPLIGNRIFGCDICQEVCPFNGPKFVALTREPGFLERTGTGTGAGTRGALPLVELMAMTREEWDAWTRGSALRRAGYAGFRRNVAVALGNWAAAAAVPVLVEALEDPEALVRGHAAWALGRIGSARARAALARALLTERDGGVVEELELALAGRASGPAAAGPR